MRNRLPVFLPLTISCHQKAAKGRRKTPTENSNRPEVEFLASVILAVMKLQMKTVVRALGMLAATIFIQAAAVADEPMASSAVAADASVAPGTRHGLFDGLDHRSVYGQFFFPEPLLVGESDVDNEVRLDWLHTEANAQQNDHAKVELEKSFGLLTVELEVPYERAAVSGQSTQQGLGNIDVGARYPFYQFVSASRFFDTTLGAALEVGIPVNSDVSKNTELVPKIFNDLRVGEHFTLQILLGYATLFGGGEEGGLQTFESGFVFGYTIQHRELPLPGVEQFIPLFELVGDTRMNHGGSGRPNLVGDAGFRVNLESIGSLQPRLGLGFVFPVDDNARAEVHWGIVTSLVFEY
jgi:hypothetical protein